MPSDFVPDSGFVSARQSRGRRSHLAGMAAEEAVCRRYLDAGYDLVASRKRCPEGEIDLLLRLGGELVAVEVKPDELPVFWACGVTPQAAIAQARPEFCITHAPGAMLITDLLNHQLASF